MVTKVLYAAQDAPSTQKFEILDVDGDIQVRANGIALPEFNAARTAFVLPGGGEAALNGVPGADPSHTAAQNTAAIQAALDAAGFVSITKPGVYLQNKSLVIGDHTELHTGIGVVLKATYCTPILMNRYSQLVNDVNRVSVASLVCTVTQQGHPFVVGDSIYVSNAKGNTTLNGVQTVTGATSSTYSFAVTSSAPLTNVTQAEPIYIGFAHTIPGASFVRGVNGYTVTVAEPGHKRHVGDRLYVAGLTGDTSFNGQTEIVNLVAGVSWSYSSPGSAGSPTGTAVVLGNTNIVLDLYEIDGDRSSITNTYYDSLGDGVRLGNIGNSATSIFRASNISFRALDVYNGSVQVPFSDCENTKLNIQFECCGDCSVLEVKAGLSGTEDDVIAWGATAEVEPFGNTANPNGAVDCGRYNAVGVWEAATLTVHQINGDSPTGVLKVFGTSVNIGNVIVDHITGNGPVVIGDINAGVSGASIGRLILNDVNNVPVAGGAQIMLGGGTGITNIDTVRINAKDNSSGTGSGYHINAGVSGTVKNAEITTHSNVGSATYSSICVSGTWNSFSVNNSYYKFGDSTTVSAWQFSGAATNIKNLLGLNCAIEPFGSGKGNLFQQTGATIGNVFFDNAYFTGPGRCLYDIQTASATPATPVRIHINNCKANSYVNSGGTAQTGVISVSNCSGFNEYYNPISVNGAAWEIYASNVCNYRTDAGYGLLPSSATAGTKLHSTDVSNSPAYAASVTPNLAQANIWLIGTLTGAITVNNPSNLPAAGEVITFRFTQDGTGGRNVSWGSNFVFPVAWSNTGNTANTVSIAHFVSTGTKLIAVNQNAWA